MTAYSAYIHIPFCTHKCSFCDFTIAVGVDHLASDYCQIVVREIEDRIAQLEEKPRITSIYFGGGTPGLIEPELIGKILHAFNRYANIDSNIEVTLETTPKVISQKKAEKWKEFDINRLSIGIESLNDQELINMGRGQTRQEALIGLEIAIQAGFKNINADLMYGLPEQKSEDFRQSLIELLALPIVHLSAYCLQLSSSLPLLLQYPTNSNLYPNDNQVCVMYETLLEETKKTSFEQYEVSNFSLPGFQSTHNLTYWKNEEYLAFGVGAHRYINGKRSSNWRSLKRYMTDWLSDETSEIIDSKTQLCEAILLGLRTRKGIDLSQFQRRYQIDLEKSYAKQIEKLSEGGFLELKNNHLALSDKGVLVSNLIISEFM